MNLNLSLKYECVLASTIRSLHFKRKTHKCIDYLLYQTPSRQTYVI